MTPRSVRARAAAVVTLALVAAACFGDDSPLPPLDYGTAPEPFDASSVDTMTPIKHVVFVIKENRTFDNMFGRFPGANGVSVGLDEGESRPLTGSRSTCASSPNASRRASAEITAPGGPEPRIRPAAMTSAEAGRRIGP